MKKSIGTQGRNRWPNLVTMFFDQVEQGGDTPFLWSKKGSIYESQSWNEASNQVRQLAGGLKSLGVTKGSRVLLVSENRPEWLIADIAIMAIGAITVPAYITNTEADHQHIIEDSGAQFAIVSNSKLTERVLPAAKKSSFIEGIITIEPHVIAQETTIKIHSWTKVLNRRVSSDAYTVCKHEDIKRDQTACII